MSEVLEAGVVSGAEAAAEQRRGRRSPLVVVAIALMVGLVCGRAVVWPGVWLCGGLGMAILAVVMRRRELRMITGVVAVVCLGAAWWGLRTGAAMSYGLVATDERRLVMVEGTIDEEPRFKLKARGVMGRFDYRAPGTTIIVHVDGVVGERGVQPADARVMVTIGAFDARLRMGQRVRCGGWLTKFTPAMNPGERDFAASMSDRGVIGRISLKNPGNCEILDEPRGVMAYLRDWQLALMRRAQMALRDHLRVSDDTVGAMLETLVLGERRQDVGELEAAFRHTGLTHLLCVAGLHLSILVGGTWWIVLTLTGRPRAALVVSFVVLVGYVSLLPPEVPLMRAAVMTAAACWAMGRGRAVSAMAALSLAAIALLLWRPMDLFSAGFQLSFVIVAGLVVFTPRVTERMRGPRVHGDSVPPLRTRLFHHLCDIVAVTIVAWLISLPLVAYHFQIVSPIALPVGIVMLPIGAAVLWSGYIKVMAGLIWPTMGEAIGHVTGALADFLAVLVKWAAASPGAAIWVPTPGIGWTVATIALSAAILRGRFQRRPVALAACVIASAGWLLWPTLSQRIERRDDALTVNMFNVGDGSCYLLRSGGDTLIYDCGSSNYADITTASIGPALRAMGVMRVGTLVITHPDTDHFSGSLELIEQFHVKRVGLTDFFQAQAKRPWSAPGLLVSTLRQRGVEIVTVSRGWSTKLCDAEIEALWPPAGAVFQRDNDTSIVLSVRAGGRRVMMTGDIQHEAMKGLLTSGVDLRSDVLELPHHGSMIPPAPPFFHAVNPAVVLQSSGRRRLDPDKWAEELAKTERHITTFHGMVTLHVGTDGVMKAEHFLKSTPPEQEED